MMRFDSAIPAHLYFDRVCFGRMAIIEDERGSETTLAGTSESSNDKSAYRHLGFAEFPHDEKGVYEDLS